MKSTNPEASKFQPLDLQLNGKWLPIHQLRDNSDRFPGNHEIPKPLNGWYVTPIQSNVLSDGNVLITGWSRPTESSCMDHQGRLNGTSFVLDPKLLLLEPKNPINIVSLSEKPKVTGDVLYCSGHVPLEDGRVFFMGGARYKNLGDIEYPDPSTQREYGIPYARIFDPKTKTFEVVKENNPGDSAPADAATWPAQSGGGLAYEPGMMWYPTNTRLPKGKVLTNGGYAKVVSVFDSKKWEYLNKSVTIFDPVKQKIGINPWTLWISNRNSPREVGIDVFDYPKSFLLKKPVTLDGIERHVAIFGGIGWDPQDPTYQPGFTLLSLSESVPEDKRFARPKNAARPNGAMLHETTAAMLETGEIMITGGGKNADEDGQNIDVYNPENDTWRKTLSTGITRNKGASVLLPDGNVLILAGEDSYQSGRNKGNRLSPTLYNPQTRTVANLKPWTDDLQMRGYHNTSVLLKDGSVLVGGGRIYENGTEGKFRIGCERPDIRIFQPPYLFKGERPISDVVLEGSEIKLGKNSISLKYDGRALKKVGGVVLMALGAQTHSFDQNQRMISLKYQQQSEKILTITSPENSSIAPEGQYFLFLISEQGVPSVGRTVKVVSN